MCLPPSREARTRRGRGVAVLLAAAALATTAPAVAAPSSPVASTPGQRVVRASSGERLALLLVQARADESGASETAERIVALGPELLPEVVDAIRSDRYHERVSANGRLARTLTESQREALHGSLERFGWPRLRADLERRIGSDPSASERADVLRVIARHVPAKDVEWMVRALDVSERALQRELADAVTLAFDELVQWNADGAASAAAVFAGMEAGFLMPAIEGAARSRTRRSLDALSRMFTRRPEADALLMIEVAELAETADRPVDESVLARLRVVVDHHELTVRREGVKAVARLDDVRAIEGLIRCLEDPDPLVAQQSRRGLERLSAERFGSDAAAWRQWHDGARAWLHDEYPALRASLASGDRAAVSRALMRIARFRVFRHDLVPGVAEVTRSPDAHSASVACVVLGHFATESAIEPLLKALEHDAPEVRDAAHEALVRATGIDHGERASAWRGTGR